MTTKNVPSDSEIAVPPTDPSPFEKTSNGRTVALNGESGADDHKRSAHKSLPRRQSSFVGQSTIKNLADISSFTTADLTKLHSRFHDISHHTTISIADFRLALGIVGMTSDSILSQRLFNVFDSSKSGQLSFSDYAIGLSIMMKGTVEQKLGLSFQLIDINESGRITFDEFNAIVQSMSRTYSGIMGETLSSSRIPTDEVRMIFNIFTQSPDGGVTFENFKRGIIGHPDILKNFAMMKGKRSSALTKLTIQKSDLEEELSHYKQALAEACGHIHEFSKKLKRIQTEKDCDVGAEIASVREYMDASVKTITNIAKRSGSPIHENFSAISSSASKATKTGDLDNDDDNDGDAAKVVEYALSLKQKTLGVKLMNGRVTSVIDEELEEQGVRIGDKVVAVGSVIVNETVSSVNIDDRIRSVLRNSPARPISIRFMRMQLVASEVSLKYGENMKALRERLMSKGIGEMIFFGHRDWELVMKLMQGLQLSVNRASQEIERSVTSYDFNVKEKYTLRRTGSRAEDEKNFGSTLEQSVKDVDKLLEGHCRFVDYAPYVFRRLREMWGISDDDYVNSIGPANMLSNLVLGSLTSLSQLGTEGKSGSFFYFTSDAKYMVKTIAKAEHSLLRSILKSYFEYLVRTPDSMLCRIVGLHQMRFGKHSKFGAEKMYFLVMQNCFPSDVVMHHRFDLKGSWVGRSTGKSHWNKVGACLKDQDFREMLMSIHVGTSRKKKLLEIIESDSKFLSKMNIIDYSLLLGVHKNSDAKAVSMIRRTSSADVDDSNDDDDEHDKTHVPLYKSNDGGMYSVDGKSTFYFGIIDILTLFNEKKRWERRLKRLYLDVKGVSVQPPKQYHKRFIAFFRHIIK